MSRIIEEMAKVNKRNNHVHLNGEIKSDLWWWHMLLEHWNGVGLFPDSESRTTKVYSDASRVCSSIQTPVVAVAVAALDIWIAHCPKGAPPNSSGCSYLGGEAI